MDTYRMFGLAISPPLQVEILNPINQSTYYRFTKFIDYIHILLKY
jgi:hypothetical protein